MTFNIRQLDRLDSGSARAERALEAYQDALLELFLNSPEGQALAGAGVEPGFWATQFIYYGYTYIGVTLPQVAPHHAQEIVTELFPRKISTFSPDEADEAIPELIAFWEYLKREYKLGNADAILKFLHQIQPNFKGIMNDPANFGTAKSFFMQGQTMGFDMTTEEGSQAFMAAYNASLLSGQAEPLPLPSPFSSPLQSRLGNDWMSSEPGRGGDKKDKAKKKKLRKLAQASRKKNKKRK